MMPRGARIRSQAVRVGPAWDRTERQYELPPARILRALPLPLGEGAGSQAGGRRNSNVIPTRATQAGQGRTELVNIPDRYQRLRSDSSTGTLAKCNEAPECSRASRFQSAGPYRIGCPTRRAWRPRVRSAHEPEATRLQRIAPRHDYRDDRMSGEVLRAVAAYNLIVTSTAKLTPGRTRGLAGGGARRPR